MNTRIPTHSLPQQATTTTVFISGNSQAVRLPKEFRFSTKQVIIEKRGDEIVLRERKLTLGELLKSLPDLTKEEAGEWDRVMAGVRDQPAQERNWDDLFGVKKKTSKKVAAARKQVVPRSTAPRK